ncbi:hypothetical protein NHX12_005496 [Muraenolepis orangiensis]|uniref:Uncharacterized protein n=1 Tax=Muraenolepis orangiensis TaxID=630683 RepID=A0A9Q0DQS4_9TELE|nr:hypothetical protein NHX12_005496 [Muraenolepis orangiensis]
MAGAKGEGIRRMDFFSHLLVGWAEPPRSTGRHHQASPGNPPLRAGPLPYHVTAGGGTSECKTGLLPP